jgi:hypothetical protein
MDLAKERRKSLVGTLPRTVKWSVIGDAGTRGQSGTNCSPQDPCNRFHRLGDYLEPSLTRLDSIRGG